MFSPPHQFEFFLFIILLFGLTATTPLQVKDIIGRVLKEEEISSIAFFGGIFELESVLSESDANILRMVFTESYGDLYFSSRFNKNILAIACINLWQRSMLNRMDIAFHGIHAATRSIYLIRNNRYKNLRYLAEHFEWCWAKGFANVLVIFLATNETYSYTRFPVMRIFQGISEEHLFPDRFGNLMGYSIRTPLQYDPPRVLEYVDLMGRKQLTGYCADIFAIFLKKHNATMKVVRLSNSTAYDIPEIVQLIRGGLVDISIHTFMDLEGIRTSYPVRMMQWCILVPFRGEIGAYWYFIRPFQFYLWISCLGVLIFISFYVTAEEYSLTMNYDFGRSCCEVFQFMLCLPFTDRRPFALRRAFHRALVFMLGFMLTNLYLAYLTSFLAKIIFESQIETLAELVTNNISVLIRDFEIPLILRNKGLPAGFEHLLIATSATDLMQHRGALRNQSFAYTTTDDKALFVLMQQMHLRQPLYKIVDETVSTIPMGFLMAKHSPFEGILNRLILRVNSAGLLTKWWNDMSSKGLKAGILTVLPSNEQHGLPLSMEHFQFAWIALGGGLGMATICAIFEKFVRVLCRFRIVVEYHR